ncbi:MAG: hypothetical protein IKR42_00690 [Campylobacter sp.]|nr:hypothetical protein [Campylobacter sp.]MBR6953332.1 hypothetical protein [Campylobacter sp.]
MSNEKEKLQQEFTEEVLKFAGRSVKALFRTVAHCANSAGIEKINPVFEFFDEKSTDMDLSLTDKIKDSFKGNKESAEKMKELRSKYEEFKNNE